MMKKLLLLVMLVSSSAFAERQIAEIAQPISLLGTEDDSEPLHDGQVMPAIILSRPTVVGGAFPESPVIAMCLPHHISGAPEGFPKESNLILLVGADIRAEWGEESHTITADFSKAKAPENLGITILQVMQLTNECLQQNLQGTDTTPIKIHWKTPLGQEALAEKLPKEIRR